MNTEKEPEKSRWLERLQFYTKDFTKSEAIEFTDYVVWKKCEIAFQEGQEIKKLIEEKLPEPTTE